MRLVHTSDALSRALADPSRRAILEFLRFGRKSVGELVDVTRLKQPNVSNHRAIMRREGIVRAERNGRNIFYSIGMPSAELMLQMHEFANNPLGNVEYPRIREAGADVLKAPNVDTDDCSANVTVRTLTQGINTSGDSTDRDIDIAEWRSGYLRCLSSGDEKRASAVVDKMLAQRLSIEMIYQKVFEWSIMRIGDLYQQGLTDEAHEHIASAITERMMAKVGQFHAPVGVNGCTGVLGCVAGNYHALGLRMLSDALIRMGWETQFLGANVPTQSFVDMVASRKTDLVVISCAMKDHHDELVILVRRLNELRLTAAGERFEIAVGGAYYNANSGELIALPIDFTTCDLAQFCSTVGRRFEVPLRLQTTSVTN